MAFSVSYQYRIDDRYTRPLQAIKSATAKFRTVTEKTSASVRKMGSKIGSLEGIAASVAGVLGGASMITKFTTFEDQINATAAVLDATDEQFMALKKTAIDLGATTRFTAAEVSSGMLMLAKNNLSLAETMDAIPAALSLAAATGADLSLTADLATDVLANFGSKAAELPGIMDKITGTTIKSKLDIQKLTFALANSTAQASDSKIPFLDTVTALAGISSGFASGERAGTSFSNFLKRLTPKSKEQIRAMKSLGLMTAQGQSAFRDSTGTLKSLAEITDILGASLNNLNDEQRSLALETIFGSNAMRAASLFAKIGSKEFNRLSSAIEKVRAAEIAEKRLKGLTGSILLLKSALNTLLIEVFEAGIAKRLSGMADTIRSVSTTISGTAPWFKAIIGYIGGIVVGLAPLVISFKVLSFILIPLIKKFAVLKTVMVAVWAGTVSPIVGAIVALTALLAVLTLIVVKWKEIKEFFSSMPRIFAERLTTFGATEDTALLGGEGPGIVGANAKAKSTASTLNGKIDINAPPGVVKSTALETSAPGDLGMNLAGTF